MRLPGRAAIAGALFGLIPVGLGTAALATKGWIKEANQTTYGLLTDNLFFSSNCNWTTADRDTVKGLEIAGVAAILVGIIVALVLHMLTQNRWLRLLSQIFLFGGPTLILIGLILFLNYALSNCASSLRTQPLDKLYSLILMIVTCLLGFLTAIYFAFIAWYGSGSQPKKRRILAAPPTVRF